MVILEYAAMAIKSIFTSMVIMANHFMSNNRDNTAVYLKKSKNADQLRKQFV